MEKAFIAFFSLVLLFQGCVQESKPTVTTLSEENPIVDQTNEIPSTTFEETSTTYSSEMTAASGTEMSIETMGTTTTNFNEPVETTTTESTASFETTTTGLASDTPPLFEEEEIPYNVVFSVAAVDGKVAYITYNGDTELLILDGVEIARGQSMASITDINGKIAYRMEKSIGGIPTANNVIVYDGKVLGDQYDNVFDPVSVGGKLAYTAVQGDRMFIVYDGNEIGKEYLSADSPADVNGELAYVGYKNQSDWAENTGVIVYKGDEIDYRAQLPRGVNGKLAYVTKNSFDGKFSVVYDRKGEWRTYANIGDIKWIGGKLAYTATEDLYKYFLVYDDKEIGKEYNNTRSPMEYRGKLLYIATLSGHESPSEALIWDGKKISNDYYEIANNPVIIDGKLVFAAKKNNNGDYKWYWVKEK